MKTKQLYNRHNLSGDYPELYTILETIFAESRNRTKYRSFWIPYSGKYKFPNGKDRAVSLGQIIDFLRLMGYGINYVIES